jgi:hypothetical protein
LFEADEEHWHGAAPNRLMVHLAINDGRRRTRRGAMARPGRRRRVRRGSSRRLNRCLTGVATVPPPPP